MKFCPKLFQEINFEPASLQPCCDVRSLKVPSFPYSGGPVDMKAYAAHLQAVCDELQAGGPVCAGCPELREAGGALTFDVKFKAVTVNMHRYVCNCKCTYCNLWSRPERGVPYSVLPGLKSLHEGGFLDEYCAISWGGGEPSILPEFDETAKWAGENLYWQYVHTNAIRFSPVIAGLLNLGLGHLNVSLDSGARETYRKVKGVDAWQKVTANLRQYCEHGNPANITLKYIVFDANNSIGEIERFLLFCADLGIGKINYSLNFLETNAGKASEKTITAAAYLKKRAQDMGITAEPFYLDEPWLTRLEEAARQL